MNKEIIDKVFKNYDIRGLNDSQITEEFAYAVGNAFVTHYSLKRCVVGRDARSTSEKFEAALINGITDAGCDVLHVGLVSTPQMKWIVAHFNHPAGIMVTASHNPPQWNGFKFVGKGGIAIGQDAGLHDIKALLDSPSIAQNKGEVTEHRHLEEFVRFSMEKSTSASPREVFVDGSGGVFSEEMKKAAELGEFNFTIYNCELDPSFLVHSPNPLDPAAVQDAKDYCGSNNCIGIVFDADGDRSIFIDENGEEVPGDYFGAWLAKRTFKRGDGATATVRDSRAVRDYVEALGGKFMLGKVGHANIQKLMFENDLRLGTEKSGHVFFRESYTAENGLLGLLWVLDNLKEGETFAESLKEIRENYFSSPEINFRVLDRQEVIDAAKKHYATKADINMMDGMLAQGDNWWVNIRPSNTEPLVRLSFEASSKEQYKELEEEARSVIEKFGKEEAHGH